MAGAATTESSKAILITGGARGIGRGLARFFLQKGHRVFLLDIDEKELTYTTNVHLKLYAARVASSLCNLRDVHDIRTKVEKAAEFFGGRIDVLINNGGVAYPFWRDGKTMENPDTLDEWNAYIETNLTAPFAASQACIPFMKTPDNGQAEHNATHSPVMSPCIIHISSFRAHQSDANQEGYASTKAGLVGLTHSMAMSCKPWGIRVNLIAPGRVKVAHECQEADEKGIEWADTLEAEEVGIHMTNRPGRAEDIAHAAEYLIEAGFVTGQDITVDGGATKMKNKS